MSKYYKWLGEDRRPYHGGKGVWPAPGEWLEVEGELEPCSNGLHLCRRKDLLEWIAPALWEVEAKGKVLRTEDKMVARKARLVKQLAWDDRVARLFAADCAARALGVAKVEDERCHNAVRVARRFAFGLATEAARDTARVAARDAARVVAWDAARVAAWAAAWDVARDAARDAAWAAAWVAERRWQTKRLLNYAYGKVDLDGIKAGLV